QGSMAVTSTFRGKPPLSSPIVAHEGIFLLAPRLPLLDDNGPLHPQLPVKDAEVAERARGVEGEGPRAAADAKGTHVSGIEVLGRVEHRARLGRSRRLRIQEHLGLSLGLGPRHDILWGR